ncbi:hypothetical protein Tco_0365379 [Tanacetum coccineum]
MRPRSRHRFTTNHRYYYSIIHLLQPSSTVVRRLLPSLTPSTEDDIDEDNELFHSDYTDIDSNALAAFYTRQFVEKFPDIKPPLLQFLISFWQYKNEHVRMAAHSLFHCAASRAIPHSLR